MSKIRKNASKESGLMEVLKILSDEEINKANQLKLDYIFNSPVKKTKSHEDASSIGWQKFKKLRKT